jgi:hypothetical protein
LLIGPDLDIRRIDCQDNDKTEYCHGRMLFGKAVALLNDDEIGAPQHKRMSAMAASTLAAVRPLTITLAPSRARVVAIALPMPPVEAVTRASLSSRWRFMTGYSSSKMVMLASAQGQPEASFSRNRACDHWS